MVINNVRAVVISEGDFNSPGRRVGSLFTLTNGDVRAMKYGGGEVGYYKKSENACYDVNKKLVGYGICTLYIILGRY